MAQSKGEVKNFTEQAKGWIIVRIVVVIVDDDDDDDDDADADADRAGQPPHSDLTLSLMKINQII